MHTAKEKNSFSSLDMLINIDKHIDHILSKRNPFHLLIIISRCHSRLWIAVISIDIITSTRFLQTISSLINSHIEFFESV
jgi:hypothetical protein